MSECHDVMDDVVEASAGTTHLRWVVPVYNGEIRVIHIFCEVVSPRGGCRMWLMAVVCCLLSRQRTIQLAGVACTVRGTTGIV